MNWIIRNLAAHWLTSKQIKIHLRYAFEICLKQTNPTASFYQKYSKTLNEQWHVSFVSIFKSKGKQRKYLTRWDCRLVSEYSVRERIYEPTDSAIAIMAASCAWWSQLSMTSTELLKSRHQINERYNPLRLNRRSWSQRSRKVAEDMKEGFTGYWKNGHLARNT